MTQEEKDLLLKDLCGRLPYRVKVKSSRRKMNVTLSLDIMTDFHLGCNIKPYLRPMSSMTEEEIFEVNKIFSDIKLYRDNTKFINSTYETTTIIFSNEMSLYIDWLNKNMFDYRGLIEKGLAIEAPEGMYGKEEEK